MVKIMMQSIIDYISASIDAPEVHDSAPLNDDSEVLF